MTGASALSSTSASFIELKNAYSTAMMPQILTKFNIGTILSYFLEIRQDFKAIRESCYELFTSGHVHVSMETVSMLKILSFFLPLHRIT